MVMFDSPSSVWSKRALPDYAETIVRRILWLCQWILCIGLIGGGYQ